MGVPLVRLDEIAEVRLGRQRSPKNHVGPNMRPYVRAANVGWDGLLLDDVKTMNFTDDEMNIYRLQPGDLLLGEASGSPKEVGKPAIWSGEIEGCAFQNTLLRVRPRTADSRYLLHFFRHEASSGHFASQSRGVGIHHLGRQALASWLVPLPSFDEQCRIAKILDQADAAKRQRTQVLEALDTLAHSIFVDMFGDPAANQKGWPCCALSSLVRSRGGIKCGPFGTQLGKSEYQTSGIPLWGIRQVNRRFLVGTEEYLAEGKAEELADYSLCGGDIVMTRKGTVGNCAVYPKDFPLGIMHSDLLRIRLNGLAEPTFMAFQLRHSPDVAHQLSLISGGAVMPGINVSKLSALQVLLPPLDLQRRFAHRLADLGAIEGQTRKALELHDSLIAALEYRAFRGEL